MQGIFVSPLAIAIIWPLVLVILEVALNLLASASPIKAQGERKLVVWFDRKASVPTGGTPANKQDWIAVGPVAANDLSSLKTRLLGTIQEVETLPPALFESLRFGIDLCLGAIATDLAFLFAVQGDKASATSMLMIHLVLAFISTLVLNVWGNDKKDSSRISAVWATNVIGVIAISLAYLVPGSLATR